MKLTENAFRDVNLAFANEISMVCDELDVEVNNLVKLANHHPRVNILNPGCGVRRTLYCGRSFIYCSFFAKIYRTYPKSKKNKQTKN